MNNETEYILQNILNEMTEAYEKAQGCEASALMRVIMLLTEKIQEQREAQ